MVIKYEKQKYFCKSEECDNQLTGEDVNISEAIAGGDVLCQECQDEEDRQKKYFAPVSWNYDEIFSDIFGGA
jgi:hypothetical protein